MTDYKDRIGTHAQFDDPRYWRFERNSGLPRGSFDEPKVRPDVIVVAACAVCLTFALWIAQWN